MAAASTRIFIDEHHPGKETKKCAISICVTHKGKRRYYRSGVNLTMSEYTRMTGERPRKELKDILSTLQKQEAKARDIIDKMPVFNFTAFERIYIENAGALDTIDGAFDSYIEKLNEVNSIGTAVAYNTAKNSLMAYCEENNIKDALTFSHIDVKFLKEYDSWMRTKGCSPTTISIYLRSLRCLFNVAIEDGLITRNLYPFGRRRYEIPTSKNIKKSLTLAEIGLIYNYKAESGSTTERMRDYWMFIYYCNGINVKDLCRLRYKNLQGDILVFQRAKTERTKKETQEIRVPLEDDAKVIIKKYGNKRISDEAYIFPVLQPGISPKRERELIQLQTRLINNHMKKIAKELEIKANVTTYVARHSFATILKRSGASVEFISEALNHGNVKTTQNYLAGFEDEKKREVAKALTAFKNVG